MSSPERRRIDLSPEAQDDFEDIVLRGSLAWGQDQGETYGASIRDTIGQLAVFPFLGRAVDQVLAGARSLVVREHVIYYRVGDETVFVLRILDRRQDAEELLRR